MKTCVIVVNYNGMKFLQTSVEKIAAACAENDIPLFISDNRSTDGSIAFLHEKKYNYTVNTNNSSGFAANVNNGLRYAASQDHFDYYIIASNDTEIRSGFFKAFSKAVAVIAAKDDRHGLIGFDETLADRMDYFTAYDYETYDTSVISKEQTIPGFFFTIRKELLSSIGYMDEEYFMYGEDNDYYTRTRQAGFSLYNTQIPVLHYSEGSSTSSKLTSWYVYRNAFLYAQKNLSFAGGMKMFFSFVNQLYNPFYRSKNPGNERVRRNGFFYNNYLLAKSLLWNLQYFIRKKNNKNHV